MRKLILAMVMVMLTAGILVEAQAKPQNRRADTRPNILFILTDDERIGMEQGHPYITSEIINRGTSFTNAMVPNPLCCPSRASILAGDYSHTTKVWGNAAPLGGFSVFRDSSTVATWLHDGGYETALVGKYLNGYGSEGKLHYVPPGWDTWRALYNFDHDNSYDAPFKFLDESATIHTDDRYVTTWARDEGLNVINNADPSKPLFMYWAPVAPHGPATPASGDEHALSELDPYRPPSYNEKAIGDKPGFARRIHRWTPKRRMLVDAARQNQYESLLEVDRSVHSMLDALDATGRLDNTVIIYMSDNGFLWGEHRLYGKGLPYDMATRVPMAIRWDAAGWNGQNPAMVENVDIAPTLADLAEVATPSVDGHSIRPLLDEAVPELRSIMPLEYVGTNNGAPSYCGVRTPTRLYVRYASGFEEFYNYTQDPYELRNRAYAPGAAANVRHLRNRAKALCFPTPPKFHW